MSDLNSTEFEPNRHLLTSRAEYTAAFNQVLGLARHELRIFDPDLTQLPLASAATLNTLRDFLSRRRDNRIYIALHNPDLVARLETGRALAKPDYSLLYTGEEKGYTDYFAL